MTTSLIARTTSLLAPIRSLRAPRPDVAAQAARKERALAIDANAAIGLQRRNAATFIDLRDWEVLDRTGWIQGSMHCPPGEFATLIDPASPLHARLFEPGGTFIFYGGPRSSPLAAARKARALGLKAMALRGGLRAWREAGGKSAGHPESAFPVLKSSFGIAYRFTMRGVRRRLMGLRRRFGMAGAAR